MLSASRCGSMGAICDGDGSVMARLELSRGIDKLHMHGAVVFGIRFARRAFKSDC